MNVGIDLGTTYSAVAAFDKAKGSVKVLKNSEGEITTPSVTCVENGRVYIGNEAKSMMKDGNLNCASFYKNMMGEEFTFFLDDKEMTAEDISALFLRRLKEDIESANGIKIDGAVITVPAYFDEKRRNATMNAGKRAGLKVLKIINEPTSAIIAYGLTGRGKKTAMVYDLGGGTFDVTVAEIDGTHVNVLTTNGDHTLGGKNWDSKLFEYLAAKFNGEFGVDINAYPEEASELLVRCEELKKKLSAMNESTVVVRCSGYSGRYTVTRSEFEEMTEYLLNQTEFIIQKCFDEMRSGGRNFGWSNIDEVVLVGGSTRMPQVRNMIVSLFGREPVTSGINVDTIVAAGAAMQAELATAGSLVLGGARTPGHMLSGSSGSSGGLLIKSSDIEDVTAHGLGMIAFDERTSQFVCSIILEKNSKIGVPKFKDYSIRGNKCEVYVLQGESADPYDCNLLYAYVIKGLNASVNNDFSVTFLYDANGMVQVSARTKAGQVLDVEKLPVTESLGDLLARLKKEREQVKNSNIEVALVVDVSGSMEGDPINEAVAAVTNFVKESDFHRTKLCIVRFAESADILCRMTNEMYKIKTSIGRLKVDGTCGYGTKGGSLFYECSKLFAKDGRDIKVIVVLTDGYWEGSLGAEKQANQLKNDGVIIYAIGIADADDEFLERIASPGCSKKIDLSKLGETFGQIASTIANVK